MSDPTAPTYAPSPSGATPLSDAPLAGRVCVVTGATRGIGRATALALARLGATLVVHGRDRDAGERVLGEIRREQTAAADGVSLLVADLSRMDEVGEMAHEIARRHPKVHVLVHNAGVHVARRTITPDGFEATFAVNHLAPFLLTRLLLQRLRAGAPSRVITMTSMAERLGRIAWGDLMRERRYGAQRAYAQSKLANILFTRELARREATAGGRVAAYCVSPGLVTTDLLREQWWWRLRWLAPVWRRVLLTPEDAARRVAWLASARALDPSRSGECFGAAGRRAAMSGRSRDARAARRLWEESERLLAPWLPEGEGDAATR